MKILTSNISFVLFISLLFAASCSKPVAVFTYSGVPKAPSDIQFKNESEKAEKYEWDFGDGNTSTEKEPTHRYTSSGNYTVQLKAIDKKSKTVVKKSKLVVDAPTECLVQMETPYGNILIQLFDQTPKHQDNFIKLVESHFYDSLLFHRVIKGFMIQGGDPTSKNAPMIKPLGMGGPGYTIPAEFVDSLVHIRGAVAGARLPDNMNPRRNSSGSQFYIVQGSPVTNEALDRLEAKKGIRYGKAQRDAYLKNGGTPFLDHDYTVFGRVIEGMDVVDKIAEEQTNERDRPLKNMWMKIEVIR